MLNYAIVKEEGACIVFLSGSLNAENASEFSDVLLGIEEHQIVIDMSKVHYITSDGLKPLLFWIEKTRPFAGRRGLSICGLQSFVRQVFEACGQASKFRIFADLDEALNAD
jgi:anti-anti-sigma factor